MTDSSALGSEPIRRLDYAAVFLMVVTIMVFVVPILLIFPPMPVEPDDALRQTHSKLGRPSRHNNPQYHHMSDQQPQKVTRPTIKSLFVYPIKSCRGIELNRSKVLPTGLEYDRLFMFAQLKPTAAHSTDQAEQSQSWEFLSQRQLPLLANVKVDVWLPDASKKSRQLGHLDGKFLLVRFPWQPPGWRGIIHFLATKFSRGWRAVPEKQFLLPLEFPSQTEIEARSYDFADVKIWVDVTRALNMSKDLPPQLAMYLGAKHQLALFRSDPSSRRQVFRCAPRKETLGYQPVVDFHDAMPNVDPATGVRHSVEPDRSLRKYRDIDDGAPRMGCLGMQLCPMFPGASTAAQLESYVEVGMRVEVLKRGLHKYLKQSA
ncbi:hypothetical protein E4U55_003302 [Claviceps digitariae]|nr:hypothetical protein E4U55_003302 [Claviceps digitariae]